MLWPRCRERDWPWDPVVGGYLWEHIHDYAPLLAGAFLLLIATALSLLIRADLHSVGYMVIICPVSEEEDIDE